MNRLARVLGILLFFFAPELNADEPIEGPCLRNQDCANGAVCLRTRCSPSHLAWQEPAPAFGITIFAQEEDCPGALKIGIIWRSQITAMMRASHFDVHWHENRKYAPKQEDILREMSEIILARRRANLRVIVGCSSEKPGYEVRFEVFDPSTMKIRPELNLKRQVHRLELTPHLLVMEEYTNRLVSIDGGPPGILGSRIAFVCKLSPRIKEIYSLEARGVDLRRETHFRTLTLLPAWTNDLRVAATTYIWKNPDIFVHGKPFLTRPGLNTGVDFHTASKRFLVASGDQEAQDIFLGTSEDGKIIKRLTHDPGIDTAPEFSPQGDRFVFVSDREGSPQIFAKSVSGGKAKRISWMGSYNTSPTWSPDGRTIAWARRRGAGRCEILTADVQKPRASTRVILRSSSSYETPSFSPDGRYLVVAKRKGGKSVPAIFDLRNETVTELAQVELPGPCNQPAWSPTP